MGHKPEGGPPLTGAERQARYRARHSGPMDVPMDAIRHHRSPGAARIAPRAQRWADTVTTLVTLQAEYAAWLEALPDATRDGPTGEALQAITDLDLDEIAAIRPPRGFGRD
jgi:hypothetical protein